MIVVCQPSSLKELRAFFCESFDDVHGALQMLMHAKMRVELRILRVGGRPSNFLDKLKPLFSLFKEFGLLSFSDQDEPEILFNHQHPERADNDRLQSPVSRRTI